MLFGSQGGSLWLLLKLCNISVQQLHLNSQKKKKNNNNWNWLPKNKRGYFTLCWNNWCLTLHVSKLSCPFAFSASQQPGLVTVIHDDLIGSCWWNRFIGLDLLVSLSNEYNRNIQRLTGSVNMFACNLFFLCSQCFFFFMASHITNEWWKSYSKGTFCFSNLIEGIIQT